MIISADKFALGYAMVCFTMNWNLNVFLEACLAGNFEGMNAMIDMASSEQLDEAMQWCLFCGPRTTPGIERLILEVKKRCITISFTTFAVVLSHGSYQFMEFLANHFTVPVHKLGSGHGTLLHLASYYGNVQHVRLMLRCGSDVNMRNEAGRTPLHFAAAGDGDKSDCVRVLLAHGADACAQSDDHETPLSLAKAGSFTQRLLLHANALIPSGVPLLVPQGALSQRELIDAIASNSFVETILVLEDRDGEAYKLLAVNAIWDAPNLQSITIGETVLRKTEREHSEKLIRVPGQLVRVAGKRGNWTVAAVLDGNKVRVVRDALGADDEEIDAANTVVFGVARDLWQAMDIAEFRNDLYLPALVGTMLSRYIRAQVDAYLL